MPAGEGGSFFRALVPLWSLNPKNLHARRSRPLTRYRWPPLVVQVWVDDASARNYSVVMNLTSSYVFFSFVCALVCAVWSRRQHRLRVLDICATIQRPAEARELLVVVPPADIIILRRELPHVVGELALEPEQSFS